METCSTERILEIRPVSYTGILDSPAAKSLLEEYGAECSIPEIGCPNPQRDLYDKMESSGMLRSFGAFENDVLIGFATILVFVLPHYGKKIATVESLFLAAAHRRNGYGLKLIEEIEARVMRLHCVGVMYNARVGTSLEKLLQASQKYQRTNSVFLRSFA